MCFSSSDDENSTADSLPDKSSKKKNKKAKKSKSKKAKKEKKKKKEKKRTKSKKSSSSEYSSDEEDEWVEKDSKLNFNYVYKLFASIKMAYMAFLFGKFFYASSKLISIDSQ